MIAPILLKEYVMDLTEPAYACLDLEETTVEVIMIFFTVWNRKLSRFEFQIAHQILSSALVTDQK